jgi:hypothetical protein
MRRIFCVAWIAGCGTFGASATDGLTDAGTADGADAASADDAAAVVDTGGNADAAPDGSPSTECTGTALLRDSFDARAEVRGAWTSVFNDNGGAVVIQNDQLAIAVPEVADPARPRTALGLEAPGASRLCISFEVTIALPDPNHTYATGSQVLFGYLGMKWADDRLSYAGLSLNQGGAHVYAEHTDGEYEYQLSGGLRDPAVHVKIVADFMADTIEMWVGTKKHAFPSIRGNPTGNPAALYVVVGVSQHGPVPAAAAKYDNVHITLN